ncbi:hypothetical protein CHUAL_008419 [Chamberlinius hualienensis]
MSSTTKQLTKWRWTVIAILSMMINVITTHPMRLNSVNGQQIRHFVCNGKIPGSKGVCMFALECIKNNGSHLGTCIDRFYFGSCCDLSKSPHKSNFSYSEKPPTTGKPISLRQWKRTTFMHKCGAALLNDNWAITAAHCVDGVLPEELLLRIGEYDLSSTSEPLSHIERRVQIMTTHPDFNPRTFENDLALLRFYEPISFRENIIPICLPTTNDTFVNKTGYVTGWGRIYEVQVPVITNSECEQEYRKAGFLESIPDIFLCAGYVDGGRDSCEGDSGGPLVIKQSNGKWMLAGVISWGIGCAEPHQPGVYTRISHFKDWINRILVF